jgi:formate dehydrogenase iron-sulfur subunit
LAASSLNPTSANGCGYCVVACPFGLVNRRPDDGRAFTCTSCYDPQKAGLRPSATACPTQSIQFGEIEDLRERATRRLDELRPRGIDDAQLYDGSGGSVGATYAMFIFRGNPEEYNLPATPDAPTVHLRSGWRSATLAAGLMLAGVALAFVRGRRESD